MPNVSEDQYYPVRRNLITGMNSKQHPTLIGPTHVEKIINGDLSQLGRTKKRTGFSTAGNTVSANILSGMARFNPSGGTDCILGVEGTNIRHWDGSGNWSAAIDSGMTGVTYTKILVGNDLALVLNGTDNVHSVNASFTVADLADTNASPPKGTVGTWFKDRWFIALNGLVYFSGVGNQTFDRGANYFRVSVGDNDSITNIVPFRNDEMYIFKEHSIHQLYCPNNSDPLNDWWLRPVDVNVGCIAKDSAVQVGDDIYFFSEDGVRSLKRNEQDKVMGVNIPISDPIYTTWIENINWSVKEKIRGVYYPPMNCIIWAVPYGTSTVPNYWHVYFLQQSEGMNGWSVWKTEDPNSWTTGFVKYPINGEMQLFFSDSSESQIFKMFDGDDDDGEGIEYEEIGRMEDLAEMQLEANQKYGISLYIKAGATDQSQIDLDCQVDEEGWQDIGTVDLDIAWPALPVNLPFTLTGKSITNSKSSLDVLEHFYNIQYRLQQTAANSQPLEIMERMFVLKVEGYETD